MHILTAAEMAQADRLSADMGVPLQLLMENAGAAVARLCRTLYPSAAQVLVLCGRGNNGGDGLVAARRLAHAGLSVRVLVVGAGADFHGEAAVALSRLHDESPSVEVHDLGDDPGILDAALDHADLILDAVVGTGFKPPLRGPAALLKQRLDRRKTAVGSRVLAPVVAIDLPSGWDADSTAQHAQDAFRADAVITFTAPKPAHVFGHLTPGQTFAPVVLADIGSPEDAVQSADRLTWTGASKAIGEPPRDINSNKGKFGHLLLVGGSYGKAGAPSMSALAALRTGAGLVTAAVPDSILNTVARVTPELMLQSLKGGPEGAASLENLNQASLPKLLKGITVLAIGPGLSTEGEAGAFARGLVETTTLPLILDADALNAYAGKGEFLKAASGIATGPATRTVVLTPHPGEMARLAGITVQEVEADRIGLARTFATEHGVTLVLKGWRTLVAHPDGRIAVNTTGNPAMAKGGSGDILTGIVAGMLAQFPGRVAEAVEAAVYLHGLAADLAVGGPNGVDEHTLLATDTVAHLSAAFRYQPSDSSGFTWICGLRTSGVHPRGVQTSGVRPQ